MIRRDALQSTGPRLDACIFDVDGTLADTEEAHRQAFNLAFRDCGLDWVWNPAQYAALLAITGGKERISGYIAHLGLPPAACNALRARVAEIHGVKTHHYRRLIANGAVAARPGIHELLLEVRAAGVQLAIASTTSPQNIEPLLESAFGSESLGWFDVTVSGDAVARKKPAPDVYHAALSALAVRPGRAMAFEDSAIGVQSAKAAGIFTVAMPNRWTCDQDFARADLICHPGRSQGRDCAAGPLTLQLLAARHAGARRECPEPAHDRR